MDRRRAEAVHSLVWLDRPLAEVLAALSSYGGDSEDAVTFDGAPILSVLDRFVSGDLTASQVEEWANAIEMRDDIEFVEGMRDALIETVFVLANPLLEGALSVAMAERLKAEVLSIGHHAVETQVVNGSEEHRMQSLRDLAWQFNPLNLADHRALIEDEYDSLIHTLLAGFARSDDHQRIVEAIAREVMLDYLAADPANPANALLHETVLSQATQFVEAAAEVLK